MLTQTLYGLTTRLWIATLTCIYGGPGSLVRSMSPTSHVNGGNHTPHTQVICRLRHCAPQPDYTADHYLFHKARCVTTILICGDCVYYYINTSGCRVVDNRNTLGNRTVAFLVSQHVSSQHVNKPGTHICTHVHLTPA